MSKIKSIKPNKRKKNLFILEFEDRSFNISADLISRFDLFSGKELSAKEEKDLISASAIYLLKNYCFTILARKMYSIEEIRKKLRLRTKDQSHIETVISELIRLKLLNDEEYSSLYIQSLKNKEKYSWKEIKNRLYQKGITIHPDQFLPEEMNEYDTITAKKIVLKKTKNIDLEGSSIKEKKKLFDFLFRKGFSIEVINRVLMNSQNLD